MTREAAITQFEVLYTRKRGREGKIQDEPRLFLYSDLARRSRGETRESEKLRGQWKFEQGKIELEEDEQTCQTDDRSMPTFAH